MGVAYALRLDGEGGWLEDGCGSNPVGYRNYPGADAPAIPPGKAVRLIDGTWQVVEPEPAPGASLTPQCAPAMPDAASAVGLDSGMDEVSDAIFVDGSVATSDATLDAQGESTEEAEAVVYDSGTSTPVTDEPNAIGDAETESPPPTASGPVSSRSFSGCSVNRGRGNDSAASVVALMMLGMFARRRRRYGRLPRPVGVC